MDKSPQLSPPEPGYYVVHPVFPYFYPECDKRGALPFLSKNSIPTSQIDIDPIGLCDLGHLTQAGVSALHPFWPGLGCFVFAWGFCELLGWMGMGCWYLCDLCGHGAVHDVCLCVSCFVPVWLGIWCFVRFVCCVMVWVGLSVLWAYWPLGVDVGACVLGCPRVSPVGKLTPPTRLPLSAYAPVPVGALALS